MVKKNCKYCLIILMDVLQFVVMFGVIIGMCTHTWALHVIGLMMNEIYKKDLLHLEFLISDILQLIYIE